MSPQIAVRLSADELTAIDALIAKGRCPSRAAAIRESLAFFLREQRELEIVEAYRRGYGEQPQEEWIGKDGLALLEEFYADRPEDEGL
jgi:Arc/MetJ-type ribon-helix-helix transcriptional regulator